jgi:hypothetical protein
MESWRIGLLVSELNGEHPIVIDGHGQMPALSQVVV